jgi:hypothetical protein
VEGGPQGGFAGDVVDQAAAGVAQGGEALGGAALDVGLDVGGVGVAVVHQAGGEPFADRRQVLDGAQVGEAGDQQVEEFESAPASGLSAQGWASRAPKSARKSTTGAAARFEGGEGEGFEGRGAGPGWRRRRRRGG